jgi:hypothetical protein
MDEMGLVGAVGPSDEGGRGRRDPQGIRGPTGRSLYAPAALGVESVRTRGDGRVTWRSPASGRFSSAGVQVRRPIRFT